MYYYDVRLLFIFSLCFQVMRAHQQLESPQWLTGGGGNNRLFDFPTQTSGNDWASNLGILSTQHPIYGSLAQQ